MNKLKAVITIGCSASGKSTHALNILDDFGSGIKTWHSIERDKFRQDILESKNIKFNNMWEKWNFKWEKEVDALVDAGIAHAVENNYNIMCSDTNLNKDRREALASRLKALGYGIEYHVFGNGTTLDELWLHDRYRIHSVGHSTIAKQYSQFRKEYPKYQLKDVTGKPEAIIFDVDGTLANMSDRSPFDWMRVGEDTPNELLFISMIAYFESAYHIIVMSGRDEVCRDITKSWIIENAIKFGCNCNFKFDLHMRKQDDQRKDTIVKSELFFEHVDGNYNVVGVYDDRPSVLTNVWMEMQFKVYCCGNPYISF